MGLQIDKIAATGPIQIHRKLPLTLHIFDDSTSNKIHKNQLSYFFISIFNERG